ncbi:hypothetical protein HOP50_14g73310 [Chloropicon primus]|uniref:TLC domain-containing protein n=1 Tax=Chloropicon primus TaxID=1764295 RepID=A0A5B8MWV4_9CHLO|nr:hypothetical protein A3770_14p73090 [Chloropicon primus]UPR04000.1 hypothetical protein HOP50_14g73310 [Chloropicon primus]|eukprot:QDZ24791.1 hypothetical protein A3770_14p73090 [Chloropicon primus]
MRVECMTRTRTTRGRSGPRARTSSWSAARTSRSATHLPRCEGGGNGGRNGNQGKRFVGDHGDDDDRAGRHEEFRGLVYGLGALGVSAVLTSSSTSGARDVALAADVPEASDLAVWLSQITAAIKGRGKQPEVAMKATPDRATKLLIGKGSSCAGVAFMWKTLLCWCTEDVELASTATDLGFLSFLGCFALHAIKDEFSNCRTFLLQACLSHIFLETVFDMGVLKMLEPEAKRRISWDMVIHHIGSLATGIYCTRVGGGKFSTGDFLKQGARLACTEITTGFPVAFKAAIKNKRFRGKRRTFFAAAMPIAFVWRSLHTLDVMRSFLRTVEECGGRKAIPSKWLGASCFGSVVGCNMYWTIRILSGVVRTLAGKGKLGKGKGKKEKEEDEKKGKSEGKNDARSE